MQLKDQLKQALINLLPPEAAELEVVIQDVPAGKPGDYGSPLAFVLAKTLKQNPVQVAADLASRVVLPAGIARAEAVGPFLNFFVDTAGFVAGVVNSRHEITPNNRKVIIEHTSVNPNKEWHVGHIRGALIGDAMARIYRSSGYTVEVQNYIDDTGRQAADSQYAIKHYGASWDGKQKYDHWLGELYVRLHADFPEKSEIKKTIETGVTEVIHALERGDLREEIAKVLRSQLETAYSLGIEYDLLVWESDVVRAGFVEKALEIFWNQTRDTDRREIPWRERRGPLPFRSRTRGTVQGAGARQRHVRVRNQRHRVSLLEIRLVRRTRVSAIRGSTERQKFVDLEPER